VHPAGASKGQSNGEHCSLNNQVREAEINHNTMSLYYPFNDKKGLPLLAKNLVS